MKSKIIFNKSQNNQSRAESKLRVLKRPINLVIYLLKKNYYLFL